MLKTTFLSLVLFTHVVNSVKVETENKTISREEVVQLIKVGVLHWSKQEYDSAAYYLCTAEKKSIEIKDTQLIISCTNNMGMLQTSIGEYDKGIKYYNKTLNQLPPNKSSKSRLLALLNIGITYKRKGDYKTALHYLFQAQKSALNFPNGKELGSCYNEIGIVKFSQKEYKSAIEYYQKSLKIRREVDYKKGIVGSLNNIGNAYKELKRYDKALKFFNESLELKKQLRNKKYLSSTYTNIGEIKLRLVNYLQAEENLQKSLRLKEQVKDRAGCVTSLCLLGELYTKQKKYTNAESYLLRAHRIAEEIKALDLQREVYLQLKNLYAAQDEGKEALVYYDKYIAVKDSIFNTENMQHMQELETRYQTREKEQQIEVLNIEKEAKAQESMYMKIVLGVFLFSMLPLGFFVKQRQKNKLLEERISGENQECNRISRELHDGVASTLSHLCRSMEDDHTHQNFVGQLRSISDEVRGISHQLNMNAIAAQNFRAALSDSLPLNHFPEDIYLQIKMDDDFDIADYNVKVNLIRITQELLNNSLKHAQASTIIVKFRQEKKHLYMEYADDGIGVDTEKVSQGNGWLNIKERVTYLSGKMDVTTSAGQGFYMKVVI